MLRQLAEPRSCTEVGTVLRQSQQRVHCHVQRLRGADLVAQVGERSALARRPGQPMAGTVTRASRRSPA